MMKSKHKIWLSDEAVENLRCLTQLAYKFRKNMKMIEKFFPNMVDMLYHVSDNPYDTVQPTEFMCLHTWLAKYGKYRP